MTLLSISHIAAMARKRKKKYRFAISMGTGMLLLCIPLHALIAQDTLTNLLFNGDFELYDECPKRIESNGILMNVTGWWQPTAGSADYLNACSRQCGVPQNKLGIQDAHSGKGMVGIYSTQTSYREYIQTELREPLQTGKRYRLTFYASLSEYSNAAIATLGGLFTQQRIHSNEKGILTRHETQKLNNGISITHTTFHEPQVVNPLGNLLNDTREWMKISDEFIARGGEKFLTIGNFFPAALSNYTEPPDLTCKLRGGYYYIDDVELVCLDCHINSTESSTHKKAPEKTPDFATGQKFVLENIFFDFNKSVLLPQSFLELDNLLTILKLHPSMNIELSGHTDGKGNPSYNQQLSEARAQAVMNFLIKNGIKKERLSAIGHGDSKPIATNKTENGRAQNRRVEFRITAL